MWGEYPPALHGKMFPVTDHEKLVQAIPEYLTKKNLKFIAMFYDAGMEYGGGLLVEPSELKIQYRITQLIAEMETKNPHRTIEKLKIHGSFYLPSISTLPYYLVAE